MRNFALILVTALFSSIFAIAIYRSVEEPQKVIVREKMPVRQIDYQEEYSRQINERTQEKFLSAHPTNFTKAAARVTPAVVNIRAFPRNTFDFFGSYGGSSGSGVIVSADGYIVTNNHVIEEGPDNIEVTLYDDREYSARLVGVDPSTDLALLKINPEEEDLPFLLFGNSDSVLVGEWVLAVGNPFNLESTVTAGIVSAKGRNIDILVGDYKIESFIQTDAAVNPGNSGGALVNTEGELVGINTAIITRSGRYEGYSFAVPANLARKVVNDLREFGKVQRAILGVRISEVNGESAERLGLDIPEGVVIQNITENSAADDAGLRVNDVIVAINGKKVKSIPELQESVARYRPGNIISVEYIRRGERQKVEVLLKDLRNNVDLPDRNIARTIELDEVLGWKTRDLTRAERSRLELEGGVVVQQIDDGSLLESTNMEPGFIITEVNELDPDSSNMRKIKRFRIGSRQELQDALSEIGRGKVLIEGIYEGYPDEWGYTFEME